MTLLTLSITASADDAQEASGTMTLNGVNLNANLTSQIAGLRFQGVTVPAGATIHSATLELNIVSGSYDDPNVTIRAQAAANPGAFTTTADDLTDRPKTSAAVTWDADNAGSGYQHTAGVAALVAEVIALPGWASGNAMAFFIAAVDASSALRFLTYDNSPATAARLHIDYSEAAAGQARRTMHQFRQRQ